MKPPEIEKFYKDVENIINAAAEKHKINAGDAKVLLGEVTAIIIQTHNATVKSMIDSLIPDTIKLLERRGYKKMYNE